MASPPLIIAAVFFKGTNAALGKFIGLATAFVALTLAFDGFILGSIIMGIAGAFLFLYESGQNSALASFGIRILFFALVFVSLMFIVG